MDIGTLYQSIVENVSDRKVSAWVAEEEMEPMAGPGSTRKPRPRASKSNVWSRNFRAWARSSNG